MRKNKIHQLELDVHVIQNSKNQFS